MTAYIITWLIIIILSWLPVFMPPRGQRLTAGEFETLPIYQLQPHQTTSVAQLRGIGEHAHIAVRPVIWTLPYEETKAILHHEAAHWVLNHIQKRILLGHLFSGSVISALYLTPWWSWPIVLMLSWMVIKTIGGVIWRGHEFDADEKACERCAPTDLIRGVARFTKDPHRSTAIHPSLAQRARALGASPDELGPWMKGSGRS